jgi:hypothetical protein
MLGSKESQLLLSRGGRRALVAVGASSIAIGASPAFSASTDHPLTVVNAKESAKNGSWQTSYDFGSTVYGLSTLITHDFVLRNDTHATVYLDRVQAACNCATLVLKGVPADNAIAPGKSFTVHMSLIEDQLPESGLDKIGWLFVRGRAKPAVTMHMMGSLHPSVSYSPAMINFRSIGSDQTEVRLLKVVMDTRVYGPNTPDLKVSGTPSLTIKRQSSHYDAARKRLERTYTVTFSPHGHLGHFDGSVYIPRLYYHGGGAVFVMGDVSGSIVSLPRAVAFGSVNRGQTVSKQIVLKGLSPTALAGLTVGSDTHDLTAKLVQKQGAKAVVQVSVSPTTPGALLSNVIVATKSGQVLKVLVSAWVN